ncbi:MAG: acyl-CoA dehydrogenase [Candidatus Dadabacteria bacterium]|nr:MAG: acyl-CoA dehydrogenase [Candidatus Dadabacteria bacterium]
MRFHFDEEARLFQQSAREFFEAECTPEWIRSLWESPAGHAPDFWRKLGELGLLGVLVPERFGGLGLDETGFVLLLEEAGRAALPLPLAETAAVAAPLLRDAQERAASSPSESAAARIAEQVLPRICAGEAVVAVALEGEPFVLAADAADWFVVQAEDGIYVLDRECVQAERQPALDPSRRLFRLEWRLDPAARIAAGQDAQDLARYAFDRAALAAAAELVGAAQRMIDMAVAYACDRQQFGQPIGAFQAVKHMLASAQVRVEFARPVVYRAAFSVARNDPERSVHVSHAKAAASEAALGAARAALQVHGAIGYTWECDLQIWMKRVWALETAWGTMLWHRRRVARRLFEAASPPPDFGFCADRAVS